jgi:phage gpG-like protein
MAKNFEVKWKDKKARDFFRDLSRNVKQVTDMQKPYVNAVSVIVFQDIMDHFEKEKGPTGKWKSWSSIYASRMAKVGKGGNKILQDTGRLRNSFLPTNWRVKSDGIEWYNPATTNNGFPYAKAHDEGSGSLPARTFMWLSDKSMDKIGRLTAAWMASGKKAK